MKTKDKTHSYNLIMGVFYLSFSFRIYPYIRIYFNTKDLPLAEFVKHPVLGLMSQFEYRNCFRLCVVPHLQQELVLWNQEAM